MIPHITKGADMRGLLGYLCSTNAPRDERANQHTEPRVVGGDAFLQAAFGAEDLDQAAAGEVAAYLDEPRRVYGTEIRAKVWAHADDGRRVAVLDDDGRQQFRDENVWHCSLSLADGEQLTAEQWQQVTREFADGMGLTEVSGKAPARWVAVHHGEGRGGHDHVHIAASMIREDGTRWEGRFRDFPRAQEVCRELEVKHGLVQVDGRERGTATRSPSPAEDRRAAQAGSRPERVELADRVRAAAVGSGSEAEFVRRVRSAGVVIKPRFAPGSADVVSGYRAALPPASGRWQFYGGGTLGHDLSLPRLREAWPAPTLEQAGGAAAEWQAAHRGGRHGPVKRASELSPTTPAVGLRNVERFAAGLRNAPIGDRRVWADAARDISGALSAWARTDPQHAAQLREAAATMARTAQQRRPGGAPGRRPGTSLATLVLLAGGRPLSSAAVMSALLDAAAAVGEWHRQTRNLTEAARVDTARRQLVSLGLHETQGGRGHGLPGLQAGSWRPTGRGRGSDGRER